MIRKAFRFFPIISLHRDPKYIHIFFYKLIYIMLSLNNKKEDSGLKILILISGGAQIRRYICIVDLYRWLLKVETLDGWKQQGYCSVGYAIRQHKISGSVIRKAFRFFSIISLHRDTKNIQICFLHINLHHAIVE